MKAAIMTATGVSLALAGHPSCDVVTIKKYLMGYIYIRYTPTSFTSDSSFPIGFVKTESGFIVRSVETGLVS